MSDFDACRIYEHDGAFKCYAHNKMWGAVSNPDTPCQGFDMSGFKKYRRKQVAELAHWEPGFDMTGVSVSGVDQAAGSPKLGDKIARNPTNHEDKWLVAAEYFEANFERIPE
jgi:hypothetical protein